MISLSDWFHTYGRRPLITLCILAASVSTIYFLRTLSEGRLVREKALDTAVDLVSLSLTQNNRGLAEIALELARLQLKALSLHLKKEGAIQISAGNNLSPISGLASSVSRGIPGHIGYQLSGSVPLLYGGGWLLVILCAGLLAVASSLMVFRRLETRFRNDILIPLERGMATNQTLPVVEVERIRLLHQDLSALRSEREVSDALVLRSRQIAHDIRSPLSALGVVATSFAQLPAAERDLLKRAVDRILGIADQLSGYSLTPSADIRGSMDVPALNYHLLDPLLQSFIQEKCLEYRLSSSAEIRYHCFGSRRVASMVDPLALSRIISNLINNSVEAIGPNEGTIEIFLISTGVQAIIEVRDNGPGIPSEILPKVMRQGFSYGKPGGTGMGLSHGHSTLETWGGSLSVESRWGEGTMIRISLPAKVIPRLIGSVGASPIRGT